MKPQGRGAWRGDQSRLARQNNRDICWVMRSRVDFLALPTTFDYFVRNEEKL